MSDRTATPGALLGRQVHYWRTYRKLSATDLARRAAEIGASTLTRVAISKIEVGLRNVSVDEWLQLAHVLAVPPPLLLLDLRSGEEVEIAPEVVLHPWLAWEWMIGAEPPIMSDQTVARAAEFADATTVIRLYRAETAAAGAVHDAESAIRTAEYAKDQDALRAAKTRHAEALRELGQRLGEMVTHGVEPPSMPPTWIRAMKRLGVLPDRVLMFEAKGADRG